MPVVSIMLVNVLQMWPKIALSHFMDETEGNNDANASTTLSLSIEFACARSMRVMAPSGALTYGSTVFFRSTGRRTQKVCRQSCV